MSRNLTVSSKTLPVFNKKKTLQGFPAEFTVPSGVSEVYVSGVAGGGVSVTGWTDVYAAPIPASGSRNLIPVASSNGAWVYGVNPSTADCPVLLIDQANAKVVRTQTAFTTGSKFAASDNGILFSLGNGSSAGHSSFGGSFTTAGQDQDLSTWDNPASIAPCDVDDPVSAVRAVFGSVSYTNYLVAFSGGKYTHVTGLAHATSGTPIFSGVRFVNGYHIALSRNAAATPRSQVFYAPESSDITQSSSWLKAAPVGDTTDLFMHDLCFGAGLYVLVGNSNKIYTATSLDGVWTERISGLAAPIYCVKFANGRFVAGGQAGTLATSTDGITWTAVTSGIGSGNFKLPNVHYDPIYSKWVIWTPTVGYWYSSNGVTWTAVTFTPLRNATSNKYGVYFGTNTGFYKFNGTSYSGMGESDPSGSDFVLQKNGTEELRLAGGLSLIGGSSRGNSYPAGSGSGGEGSLNELTMPTGTGSAGRVNYAGGGGSVPFTELAADPLAWGLKIAGASGGTPGTSGASGGGSIFYGRGAGPGAGASCTSNSQQGTGGAGEGIVRYRVAVNAGDVLQVSSGAGNKHPNTSAAGNGLAVIEWEQ